MSIRPVLIFCVVLGAAACREKGVAPVSLNPGTLCNIDSVRAAMASGFAHSDVWDKKLAQAAALYKVKHQYGAAVDSLKNILLVAPSSRGFYEYGSALMLDKQFDQAVFALRVAEELQYQPLPNLMYRLAVAYANCPDTEKLPLPTGAKANIQAVKYYLQAAIQMGLASPERIFKDSAMAAYVANYHYDITPVYNEAMTGRRDPMISPFKDFLDGFSAMSLPAQLDTSWLLTRKLPDRDIISLSFEPYVSEMHGARFAREDFSQYFYVGKVIQTPKYVAVIYAVADTWDEDTEDSNPEGTGDSSAPAKWKGGSALDTLASVYYFLTTYTPDGKIVDKVKIAGQQSLDQPLKVARLNADMTIEITDLDLIRANDAISDGDKINPIVSIKANSPQVYHVNVQGKLEKVNGPALSMK